jgi:hypothetical protein
MKVWLSVKHSVGISFLTSELISLLGFTGLSNKMIFVGKLFALIQDWD